jgi:hypothetical protein
LLLGELRTFTGRADPVPDEVMVLACAAIELRDLDAQLAALVYYAAP